MHEGILPSTAKTQELKMKSVKISGCIRFIVYFKIWLFVH